MSSAEGWPQFGLILRVFLISRLFAAIFVYLGHRAHPYLENIEGSYAGVPNWWLNPWTAFDSRHFMDIAALGYTPKTAAFFPLYPMILKLAGTDPATQAAWGVLVSNLAFLGALWFFYRLTRQDFGEQTADRALWLLAFFPISCVFSAVYTESVFLLCFTGGYLALRQRRWLLAALGFGLAASCRNSGPVLSLALIAELFRTRAKGDTGWPILIPAGAAILAFLTVQGYLSMTFGGTAGLDSQKEFMRELTFPLLPLGKDFLMILTGEAHEITTYLNFGSTILGFIAAFWLWKRGYWGYAVFAATLLTLQLTFARVFPPYTVASLRYVATTFPVVQALAVWSLGWTSNSLRQGLLMAMYCMTNATVSYLWGVKSFLG